MVDTVNSKVDEPCLDSGLISSGNIQDAMRFLDQVDTGISWVSEEQMIDALRYWMGEAFASKYHKQES